VGYTYSSPSIVKLLRDKLLPAFEGFHAFNPQAAWHRSAILGEEACGDRHLRRRLRHLRFQSGGTGRRTAQLVGSDCSVA
jgi:hypothetical protein